MLPVSGTLLMIVMLLVSGTLPVCNTLPVTDTILISCMLPVADTLLLSGTLSISGAVPVRDMLPELTHYLLLTRNLLVIRYRSLTRYLLVFLSSDTIKKSVTTTS